MLRDLFREPHEDERPDLRASSFGSHMVRKTYGLPQQRTAHEQDEDNYKRIDLYRLQERTNAKAKYRERKAKGFACGKCKSWVSSVGLHGTKNRNHCPCCLTSKHRDEKTAGDRKSTCGALMEAVGLTFKTEGEDKYWRTRNESSPIRKGELMIVHCCRGCGRLSINRIAADDNEQAILDLFERSQHMTNMLRRQLSQAFIHVISDKERPQVMRQLFGTL